MVGGVWQAVVWRNADASHAPNEEGLWTKKETNSRAKNDLGSVPKRFGVWAKDMMRKHKPVGNKKPKPVLGLMPKPVLDQTVPARFGSMTSSVQGGSETVF